MSGGVRTRVHQVEVSDIFTTGLRKALRNIRLRSQSPAPEGEGPRLCSGRLLGAAFIAQAGLTTLERSTRSHHHQRLLDKNFQGNGRAGPPHMGRFGFQTKYPTRHHLEQIAAECGKTNCLTNERRGALDNGAPSKQTLQGLPRHRSPARRLVPSGGPRASAPRATSHGAGDPGLPTRHSPRRKSKTLRSGAAREGRCRSTFRRRVMRCRSHEPRRRLRMAESRPNASPEFFPRAASLVSPYFRDILRSRGPRSYACCARPSRGGPGRRIRYRLRRHHATTVMHERRIG